MKAALIAEKGCNQGAKLHPFAPSMVSMKLEQLFWNGGDDGTRTRGLCRDSDLWTVEFAVAQLPICPSSVPKHGIIGER